MGDPRLTASTGVGTPTRATVRRGRGNTATTPSAPPPAAQPAAPKRQWSVSRHWRAKNAFSIETPRIVEEQAVREFLFTDGKLPPGFSLTKEALLTLWMLKVPPGMALHEHASKLTKPLLDAVMSSANILGIEPDEAAAYAEQERQRMAVRLDFLGPPFVGVTVGEVLSKWTSAWWETKSHFVYLGLDPAYRQRILVWCEVSKTNKRFNADMRYYLSGNPDAEGNKHLSLRDAIEKFKLDTMEEMRTMVGAFAMTMAGAAGNPARPRGPVFKTLNQETAQQVVGTAINAYLSSQGAKSPVSAPPIVDRIVEAVTGAVPGGDDEQFQADMTHALTLGVQLMPTGKGQVTRRQLGDFGEAVIRQTLEARGYEVIVFHNPSGHGLDIIAIKRPKSGTGARLVLWCEVKTSEVGSFKLSKAQQNVDTYVVSRLERAATLYPNLNASQKAQAAALLADIRSGAAVVSTGAKFFVKVDWADGSIEIKTKVWKASAPKVRVPARPVPVRPRVRGR